MNWNNNFCDRVYDLARKAFTLLRVYKNPLIYTGSAAQYQKAFTLGQ